MNKKLNILCWILQIFSSLVLLQTLRFKFTGAEESIRIFSALGMEPWGRIGVGIMELIAGIMLLVPKTVYLGALLSMGLMGGAVMSHLTVLSINLSKIGLNDNGLLFMMSVLIFISCSLILILRRREIPILGKKMAIIVFSRLRKVFEDSPKSQ